MFRKIFIIVFWCLVLLAGIIKIHSFFHHRNIRQWNFHNLKRIDKTISNFTFDVFADNKNSVKKFNRLIKMVNADSPLFAVDIGDLVFEGDTEKYNFFIKQILNFKIPFLTVIGNHDIMDDGRKNYYKYFGKFYYSFHTGNSYFIMLDNSNEKNLDPWQMDWLKKQLEISKNYKYRFVFMHVPLFDPRGKNYHLKDVNFAKKLNKLFDNYNITMLFVSHIHGYFKGKWGNTPYIITGGAGAELRGTNKNHYFYHYLRVQVNNDSVKFDVVKLKSPSFEILERFFYDVWIYIYAFIAIKFVNFILLLALIYLLYHYIVKYKKWIVINLWKKGGKNKKGH